MVLQHKSLAVLFGVLVSSLITSCSGFAVFPRSFQCPKVVGRYDHQSLTTSLREKTTLMNSQLAVVAASSQDDAEPSSSSLQSLRDKLRQITGFSLTASRATLRAATGISLSTIYASTLAATGLYVRKIMSVILSIFPAWFRYFLQPFLVLYYVPLFMIRGLTGPTRERAKAKHEVMIESWKDAVKHAEEAHADGYWPVRVNESGDFEVVAPPGIDEKSNLADAVAESVEAAMEMDDKSK